jgi:hypothetical protein
MKRLKSLAPRWFYKHLSLDKKDVIDFAFRRIRPKPRSFADLGGVWRVNAAYTFYVLDRYRPDRAVLVDTHLTEPVIQNAGKYGRLKTIQANFGEKELIESIPQLDVVLLFDVLLHQVRPDWDEVLELYAPIASCFAIFNPQFIRSDKTFRLLDLGFDKYFANVPHTPDDGPYRGLFERLYELHPEHGRVWRDVHHIWQWAITDRALINKMTALGFELRYYKNCGPYRSLENFEGHGFVFQKV